MYGNAIELIGHHLNSILCTNCSSLISDLYAVTCGTKQEIKSFGDILCDMGSCWLSSLLYHTRCWIDTCSTSIKPLTKSDDLNLQVAFVPPKHKSYVASNTEIPSSCGVLYSLSGVGAPCASHPMASVRRTPTLPRTNLPPETCSQGV